MENKEQFIKKELSNYALSSQNPLVADIKENCMYLDTKKEITKYIENMIDLNGSRLFY